MPPKAPPPKEKEEDPLAEEEVDAMKVLTDEQLRKYREVFASFDEAGEGFVSRSDVGMAMRAVGLSPSEAEIKVVCDKVAPVGRLDFRSFCQALYAQANAPNSRDAMIRAFRVFDPRGLGVLTQAEFRHVFERAGGDTRLEPQIVDDLVDYADEAQGGQVRYEEFVARIFNEFEEHKRKAAAEKAAGKK